MAKYNGMPKPKFQVGDEVFVIDNHKIRQRTVSGVSIVDKNQNYSIKTKSYEIKYRVEMYGDHSYGFYVDEESVFATKEELIASL